MRIGVIGFGAWGRFHARGWRKVAGAELAGIVAHGDGSAAEAAAEFPDVPIHRSLAALLDSGVEVVDIVAPNHLHAAMVLAALEAGCHVVVEKPLATSAADLDGILAAERVAATRPPSRAHSALRNALMTPPHAVPAPTRRRTDLFTAPYWGPWDGSGSGLNA